MSEKLVLEAFERGKAFGYAEGLKTNKVKTLTDAEIAQVFQDDNLWRYSDLVLESDGIQFARAILKKAQEK